MGVHCYRLDILPYAVVHSTQSAAHIQATEPVVLKESFYNEDKDSVISVYKRFDLTEDYNTQHLALVQFPRNKGIGDHTYFLRADLFKEDGTLLNSVLSERGWVYPLQDSNPEKRDIQSSTTVQAICAFSASRGLELERPELFLRIYDTPPDPEEGKNGYTVLGFVKEKAHTCYELSTSSKNPKNLEKGKASLKKHFRETLPEKRTLVFDTENRVLGYSENMQVSDKRWISSHKQLQEKYTQNSYIWFNQKGTTDIEKALQQFAFDWLDARIDRLTTFWPEEDLARQQVLALWSERWEKLLKASSDSKKKSVSSRTEKA